MEFVIVLYPTERDVFVGGGPHGKTGKRLVLETGTHTFDLDVPLDYTPLSQTLPVSGTTKLNPLLVVFTPKPVMRAGVRRGAKKAGKKAAKKANSTATKKTGKKAVKKTGKKTGKTAVKRTGQKAVKKTGKKAVKTVTKKARKSTTKRAKRTIRKPRE